MEIVNVKYLSDYKIEVFFDNQEKRVADFKRFLFSEQNPMTTQFQDIDRFKKVYVELGHLTWEDGQMDISAQSIYDNKFSQE
jgi:acylphosphatase